MGQELELGVDGASHVLRVHPIIAGKVTCEVE